MKKRYFITTITILVLTLSVGTLFNTNTISYWERRRLTPFPKFTWSQIQSGKTMNQMEQYLNDHIPFRPFWIRLSQIGWGKQDVLLHDDFTILPEYPLNKKALSNNVAYLNSIRDQLQCQSITMAIIPDKAYFLNADEHLKMNYTTLFNSFQNFQTLPIHQNLKLTDYYKSDPHWRMEQILPVATQIAHHYQIQLPTFEKRKITEDFLGQQGLYTHKETLSSLYNPVFRAIHVFDHEHQKEIPMFDSNALQSMDPYTYFLGGPLSMITLENRDVSNDKELVIFRDSFGSSIAPILSTGFKKITLIDTRYIPFSRVKQQVDFKNADVLFLYSTSVLNSENIFK